MYHFANFAAKLGDMAKIKSIGVLTSGGDAPGMNAAIRAVTRSAIFAGWKVYGIYRGWEGLIDGEVKEFTTESVSGIIFEGGTILRTARSKRFLTVEGRAQAYQTIKKHKIDALIVIGGNGSLSGAQELSAEYGPITPSATIRRSTPLWSAWIRFTIPQTRTTAYSL